MKLFNRFFSFKRALVHIYVIYVHFICARMYICIYALVHFAFDGRFEVLSERERRKASIISAY